MTNNLTELTAKEKIKNDLLLNELSIQKANEAIARILTKLGKQSEVSNVILKTRLRTDISLEGRSEFGADQLMSLVGTLGNLEAII